ncbi:hypothetical protein SAMD00019534_078210 [Acytostelium subglobosum LB1]|uniref:hypothetical protein n=1 Tax=Acytostelium subglobosum LB1 TaxID=1410327 RepID=UPI000644FFB0|nr:hypothetical protein SAMD00019534_078210 [Acytostelium subglobosum LB1]GAM24646.1 hypothetical protein SAMD00019534_078210 [Acytostelium subglobosum LB1]|eukprot:XP_012752315.1 hypothetical protein SAMD00019534_078210 [Acytostelium subglobosum LB1]
MSCKKGIGNEVIEKLPGLKSIFTLDKEDVILSMKDLTRKITKRTKWREIAPEYPHIKHLNSQSPVFALKPKVVASPDHTPPKPVRRYASTKFSNTINKAVMTTRKMEPRPYQIEALVDAMARNSILVMPTGSGKTLVSVMLIQQMMALNAPQTTQIKRMVLFVVTTLPLVHQQTEAIQYHNPTLRVIEVSSASDAQSLTVDMFDHNHTRPDVMVITSGSFFNIVDIVVTMKDFHLVIFDEVHHATGNHNYVRIMKEFHDVMPPEYRPRVFGLSASPSTGRTQTVIANNIASLENVMHSRTFRPPSLPHEASLESDRVIFNMSYSELSCNQFFADHLNMLTEDLMDKAKYTTDKLKYRQVNPMPFITELKRFMAYVSDHKMDLSVNIGDVRALLRRFTNVSIEGYVPFIKRLRDDLASKVPSPRWRTFLQGLLNGLEQRGASSVTHSSRFDVMLRELKDMVDTDNKLDNFRGIIFVKTRATVDCLVNMLVKDELNAKLNVKKMVGHSKEGGMDTDDQIRIMEKFTSGDTKLLVATSVIEEGIDVQRCNFVMCFENDFNIRSLIQRRGRARNKGEGKFCCLMNQAENDFVNEILINEQMLNLVIGAKMRASNLADQQREADRVWNEMFESPAQNQVYVPLGERKTVILDFCVSTPELDTILSRKLAKSLVRRPVKYTNEHEDREYLKSHKEFVIGVENSDEEINHLLKILYEVKGWWARVTYPEAINLPSSATKTGEHGGEEITAFGVQLTCGNFMDPTKFVETFVGNGSLVFNKQSRLLDLSVRHDELSMDLRIRFKTENLVSFALLDCDPDSEYQSLYIIAKRSPIICQIEKIVKNGVVVEIGYFRVDQDECPFMSNRFVYRIQTTKEEMGPFLDMFPIPFYLASIKSGPDPQTKTALLTGPLEHPILINSHLAYQIAVLKSNTNTGFGRTNIPEVFLNKLTELVDEGRMLAAEYLIGQALEIPEFASYDRLIYLDLSGLPNVSPTSLPKNHAMIKSAYVTPSRVVFNMPRIQQTNRVIRVFGADRFMTVQFTEEDFGPMVENKDNLQEYYYNTLKNGIKAHGCGTFYYLGNSNSQARCQMSWFYCVDDGDDVDLTIDTVRSIMIGPDTNYISARKALRAMALVFPSTTPTLVNVDYHSIQDMVHNDHIFTEGVGYIGRDTAHELCKAGNYPTHTSAFQIRLGGHKGVLSVHPTIKTGVFLRPSMKKFQPIGAPHDRVLEVISVSAPKTCFLNRQIILLLSQRIPDGYFMELERKALSKLVHIFQDPEYMRVVLRELSLLNDAIDETDIATRDPLIASALQSLYLKKLDSIQDKCFIPIELARTVMASLTSHHSWVQAKCDIRVLEAVDVPQLREVYLDVIAFSQHGEVPNFKECSGSDLDGDRYFVCFDQEMIDYYQSHDDPYLGEDLDATTEPKYKGTRDELIQQYLKNITKSKLGMIALSHLALSDKLGPRDPLCVQLAKEHFIEVDSIKTGVHGEIPKDALKALNYFSLFPQFMEHAMPRCSYWESTSVLGKLYQAASILRAVPQMLPEVAVDPARLVPGYDDYLENAWSCYQSYKFLVNSLLHQFDLETEVDILVKFIKDTKNMFKYTEHMVEEIRINYKRIQAQFKDEFLCDFPGDTPADKLRSSPDEIQMKAAAWYCIAYSDTGADRVLSFSWIAKLFTPKQQLKTLARENHSIISESIIDFVNGAKPAMTLGYLERVDMIQDLLGLIRSESNGVYEDSTILLYGSSSLLLFDQVQSDLDLFLNCRIPRGQVAHDIFTDLFGVIKSHEPTSEVRYVKNAPVPVIKFMMNKRACDLSLDPNGFQKTGMMCDIMNKYPFIYQLLFIVVKWGRETGLLVHQSTNIAKSRNLKTWALEWMVIHFLIDRGHIEPMDQDIKPSPMVNRSVQWWTDLLDRAININIGSLTIQFFKYYSKVLARLLRNRDQLLLQCPLDTPDVPSLNIDLRDKEEDDSLVVYLQEIFTIAHHTLVSSSSVKVFLSRCLYDKTKIINLDRVTSKSIREHQHTIISKITMESKVSIHIYNAGRRGCLQVKIKGEPSNIQHAIDQFYEMARNASSIPFHAYKSHVPGGGSVLLFRGSQSTHNVLRLTTVPKSRQDLVNIQHRNKPLRLYGLLKLPETVPHDEYMLGHSKMRFQMNFLKQLAYCGAKSDPLECGERQVYIRLGNVYLVNCSFDGEEMTIDALQLCISKTSRRELKLDRKLAFEQQESEEEESIGKPIMLSVNELRRRQVTPIDKGADRSRCGTGDIVDEAKKKKKPWVPKSSFYTHTANFKVHHIAKIFEDMGWTRSSTLARVAKAARETYILCCKVKDKGVPEFKVTVQADMQPPNLIKDQGINWFVCDLSNHVEQLSDSTAHLLDVRFCIQSKRPVQELGAFKQFATKQVVTKRENTQDGRLAPIILNKDLSETVYLIRHHSSVTCYIPPIDDPWNKFNMALEVHTIREFRNSGEFLSEKVEFELCCDLPQISDTLSFTELYWYVLPLTWTNSNSNY